MIKASELKKQAPSGQPTKTGSKQPIKPKQPASPKKPTMGPGTKQGAVKKGGVGNKVGGAGVSVKGKGKHGPKGGGPNTGPPSSGGKPKGKPKGGGPKQPPGYGPTGYQPLSGLAGQVENIAGSMSAAAHNIPQAVGNAAQGTWNAASKFSPTTYINSLLNAIGSPTQLPGGPMSGPPPVGPGNVPGNANAPGFFGGMPQVQPGPPVPQPPTGAGQPVPLPVILKTGTGGPSPADIPSFGGANPQALGAMADKMTGLAGAYGAAPGLTPQQTALNIPWTVLGFDDHIQGAQWSQDFFDNYGFWPWEGAGSEEENLGQNLGAYYSMYFDPTAMGGEQQFAEAYDYPYVDPSAIFPGMGEGGFGGGYGGFGFGGGVSKYKPPRAGFDPFYYASMQSGV